MLPQHFQSRGQSFSSSGATDIVCSVTPDRAAREAEEQYGGTWQAVDEIVEDGLTYQILMRE